MAGKVDVKDLQGAPKAKLTKEEGLFVVLVVVLVLVLVLVLVVLVLVLVVVLVLMVFFSVLAHFPYLLVRLLLVVLFPFFLFPSAPLGFCCFFASLTCLALAQSRVQRSSTIVKPKKDVQGR